VSHNTSRSKRGRIDSNRRLAELKPLLVPGWQIDPAKLEIIAVPTVLGFCQRGQEMLLRCRRPDCHRRVEIDFREAVQAGKGDWPPSHLIHILRCGHWAGCKLYEVSSTYPNGVPLIGLLAQADVLIAIVCEACAARLLLPPQAVIVRLKQAGRGDGSTGVLEVGKRVRGPCRKCGAGRFMSELVWPKAPGTG
jgi:hypothetical protein